MSENLHTGHRERMRMRIEENGAKSLQDHELLEVLLYYSIPRKDTNSLSHKIISEYGSLINALEADPDDMVKRLKVSQRTALLISLIPEFISRYNSKKWNKPKLNFSSSSTAGEYAKSLLNMKKNECFYILCLDAGNRLIKSELISEGIVNETTLNLREIAEIVLKNNASSVILAHNHPGGSLMASMEDIKTTTAITHTLNLLGIRVNDHIIVANNNYVSFVDLKLIKSSK